jgi:integrase
LPQWGDTPIKLIDYSAYSTWLGGLSVNGSQRGTPLSASRITQAHQLTGAVLKYAIKTGKLTKNVAAEIDRGQDLPEAIEAEHVYLTHAQLLTLADAAGRFDVLTLVLGYCGLRFGEAAALRRRHVKNRQITVRASATTVAGQGIVETDSTKTKRQRQVPVPEPVWKRLEHVLPHKGDDLVFPSHKGGHLPLGEYRWAFDKALDTVAEATNSVRQREAQDGKKAATPEFPSLTPHALRHTCASLAISAGANVKVVQRLLGHASATMTLDRYGHLMDDDLTGVADALGKAIDRAAVSLRYSGDRTSAESEAK